MEIKENIVKQIDDNKISNEQIKYYENLKIYYMLSTCYFIHKHGAMSSRCSV